SSPQGGICLSRGRQPAVNVSLKSPSRLQPATLFRYPTLNRIGYDMAFHEKAGRRQAEPLSIHTYKQGFSPPS
ncbi:MAG: hypothetical protein WAN69_09160, partial [Candidatus Korobacteraceae bacterium]